MAIDRGPWQDGRRALDRLRGWLQDGPAASLGHHPGEALTALADVGLIRRLLDNAELAAVKAARRQGKSWAEIATRLGVTRQSAWERWRDLDEPRAAAGDVLEPAGRSPGGIAGPLAARLSRDLAGEMEKSVLVPDVLGMSLERARSMLDAVRLTAIGPDPDGPPLEVQALTGAVIVEQDPKAGTRAVAGSPVTLWLGRGGGSAGVREPRRPRPNPKSARAVPDESMDETVG